MPISGKWELAYSAFRNSRGIEKKKKVVYQLGKKSDPILSLVIIGQEWTLLKSINTGQWRTGKGSFGQIRLKSIDLAQMARSGPGNDQENSSTRDLLS
jgi:hypothetical protein